MTKLLVGISLAFFLMGCSSSQTTTTQETVVTTRDTVVRVETPPFYAKLPTIDSIYTPEGQLPETLIVATKRVGNRIVAHVVVNPKKKEAQIFVQPDSTKVELNRTVTETKTHIVKEEESWLDEWRDLVVWLVVLAVILLGVVYAVKKYIL